MPEDFTNKDHAFFSGEKFRKSAVIVNDWTTPRTVTCRWELALGGEIVQRGEMTGTAAPGAILKLPINLTAPKVYKRTDAELRLTALKDDALILEDSFHLQFFPETGPAGIPRRLRRTLRSRRRDGGHAETGGLPVPQGPDARRRQAVPPADYRQKRAEGIQSGTPEAGGDRPSDRTRLEGADFRTAGVQSGQSGL
ncbi:MAG: hypothetical protein L6W00_22630 [Lentisphaeria bacterium]|nr:MAG: hypothetical protein L6W00_22630 [Lentisphaeria bacterium]